MVSVKKYVQKPKGISIMLWSKTLYYHDKLKNKAKYGNTLMLRSKTWQFYYDMIRKTWHFNHKLVQNTVLLGYISKTWYFHHDKVQNMVSKNTA